MVAVHGDNRIRRHSVEHRSQLGIQTRQRPLIAVTAVGPAAELGQDMPMVVQLPQVQQQKPRLPIGGLQTAPKVRPPRGRQIGRAVAEIVGVKTPVQPSFGKQRTAHLGIGVIAMSPEDFD